MPLSPWLPVLSFWGQEALPAGCGAQTNPVPAVLRGLHPLLGLAHTDLTSSTKSSAFPDSEVAQAVAWTFLG